MPLFHLPVFWVGYFDGFKTLSSTTDPKTLREMASNHNYGGIMFRNGDAHELQSAINATQEAAEGPLLVSAHLESGGGWISPHWPPLVSPLACCAPHK